MAESAESKPYQPDPLIDTFLDDLWSSRGLSDNTHAAYRTDLRHFDRYIQKLGAELVQVSQQSIRD